MTVSINSYDLVEPEDGKWGSITNRVNITFNGLVGQLQRQVHFNFLASHVLKNETLYKKSFIICKTSPYGNILI